MDAFRWCAHCHRAVEDAAIALDPSAEIGCPYCGETLAYLRGWRFMRTFAACWPVIPEAGRTYDVPMN